MDTLLFIEIILSEGVFEKNVRHIDGITSAIYIGPSNKKVPICISDEDIHPVVIRGYLRQLGLEFLIDRLPLD